jgi:hypothetical protein
MGERLESAQLYLIRFRPRKIENDQIVGSILEPTFGHVQQYLLRTLAQIVAI